MIVLSKRSIKKRRTGRRKLCFSRTSMTPRKRAAEVNNSGALVLMPNRSLAALLVSTVLPRSPARLRMRACMGSSSSTVVCFRLDDGGIRSSGPGTCWDSIEKRSWRYGGKQYPRERPRWSVAAVQPYSVRISIPCRLREIRPKTKKAVPLIVMTSEDVAILTTHPTTSVSSKNDAPSSIDPTLPTAQSEPLSLSIVSESSCSPHLSRIFATKASKCPESRKSWHPSTVLVSSL